MAAMVTMVAVGVGEVAVTAAMAELGVDVVAVVTEAELGVDVMAVVTVVTVVALSRKRW